MRKGWVILTVILGIIATYLLANGVYWILIAYTQIKHPAQVYGTFIPAAIFYIATYRAWRKAKATEKPS